MVILPGFNNTSRRTRLEHGRIRIRGETNSSTKRTLSCRFPPRCPCIAEVSPSPSPHEPLKLDEGQSSLRAPICRFSGRRTAIQSSGPDERSECPRQNTSPSSQVISSPPVVPAFPLHRRITTVQFSAFSRLRRRRERTNDTSVCVNKAVASGTQGRSSSSMDENGHV